MGTVRDLYDESIRRYNQGDVEGFAEAHTEDAILVTPGRITRGRPAIYSYWTNQRTAFPDLTLIVGQVVEQGGIVAAEWGWTGTNSGSLELRDGSRRSPTGKRVEIQGMELVRVRNGKITEYHIYWDGMSLYRQLGLLPEQSSQ